MHSSSSQTKPSCSVVWGWQLVGRSHTGIAAYCRRRCPYLHFWKVIRPRESPDPWVVIASSGIQRGSEKKPLCLPTCCALLSRQTPTTPTHPSSLITKSQRKDIKNKHAVGLARELTYHIAVSWVLGWVLRRAAQGRNKESDRLDVGTYNITQ